jgi:hypothetical protein
MIQEGRGEAVVWFKVVSQNGKVVLSAGSQSQQ